MVYSTGLKGAPTWVGKPKRRRKKKRLDRSLTKRAEKTERSLKKQGT